MSILSKYNKKVNKFDFDGADLTFTSLKELFKKDGLCVNYTVRALFINTKGKFGEQPILVATEFLVSLPTHMLGTVKDMLEDDDLIKMVNDCKVGFTIRPYTTKDGNEYFAIDWIEIE